MFDISLAKFGTVAYVAGFLMFLETTRGRQLTMYCITSRMQYSATQRESIFCSKISFGESLFIKKLVPGGTSFGGSIFTMTDPTPTQLALVRLVAVLQQEAGLVTIHIKDLRP